MNKKLNYSKKVTIEFDGDKNFMLASDLYVKATFFESYKLVFIIPKGFKTDLASVPRIFQSIFSKTDWVLMIPSIIHDYAYREKSCQAKTFIDGTIYDSEIRFNKDMADRLFKQKVKDFGGNMFTVFCVYQAVKWFGVFKNT